MNTLIGILVVCLIIIAIPSVLLCLAMMVGILKSKPKN